MLLHAMENIKKVPMQTVQSHSFIEIEGPARCERVEENEKDKVKVRQRLIWEVHFLPIIAMDSFLWKTAQIQLMHFTPTF